MDIKMKVTHLQKLNGLEEFHSIRFVQLSGSIHQSEVAITLYAQYVGYTHKSAYFTRIYNVKISHERVGYANGPGPSVTWI